MKEEKNIGSPLEGLSKGNPFKTPEGYFENLQDRIEANIEAKTTTVSRKTRVIRILRPALSLAASFALVFLLVYYPLNKFLPEYLSSNQKTEVTEINHEEDFLTAFMDESSLYETLLLDDEEPELQSEEVYALLSVEMTEYDLYTELIKN